MVETVPSCTHRVQTPTFLLPLSAKRTRNVSLVLRRADRIIEGFALTHAKLNTYKMMCLRFASRKADGLEPARPFDHQLVRDG